MESGDPDPSALGTSAGSSHDIGDEQRQAGAAASAPSSEASAAAPPAGTSSTSTSTPGSRSSVTKKRYRNTDLKSFFSSNLSSGSAPSTHQSENAAVVSEEVLAEAVPVEVEPPGDAEMGDVEADGLRIPIERFHPNIRGDVQRAYFVAKDAAFCFYCFLFKQEPIDKKFGHDAFTKAGYTNWKNAYHGLLHVGGPISFHNRARAASVDFRNAKASVTHKVETHSKDAQVRYETRVTTALGIASFLIAQGLSFRGHDETIASLNRGNILEKVEWYKIRDEEVRVAFEELCPLNAQMISPKIQKDICESYAMEISNVIKKEIGDKCFSVLIDESRDVSIAEQMAVIVRFVNNKGMVVERFLGLQHVPDTTSNALKKALVQMLAKYDLPIARLRGQGYDGASNMRGQFNGLQNKIRDENPYAFYIHCFAHQLQLVIVSVTICCSSFNDFFTYVSMIATSVGSSCQRKDKLISKHCDTILQQLESDPRDNFSKFDVDKISRLTEIYDQDFSTVDRSNIKDQLETFLLHVQRVEEFNTCTDLGSLATTMVEAKMHTAFSLHV
ncbi:zinc finger MYM-type protein 1-like [Setaria italica]|uniref:zinc finger MYM-type protein 1-like n=1 Tax=Setaria italica TaxID=4555 RepID=UPI000646B400|nr:zinc finger MYM-type protein 1-like [Setaria italica]